MIAPNRVYGVDEEITSISLISASYPFVLNYECKLKITSDDIDVSGHEVTEVNYYEFWGQSSGLFTDDPNTLRSYMYNYNTSSTAKLVRSLATTYDVYKTLNLLDIIKEDAKQQAEKELKVELHDTGQGYYADDDDSVRYYFLGVLEYSIEGDPGSEIIENGSSIKLGFVPKAGGVVPYIGGTTITPTGY